MVVADSEAEAVRQVTRRQPQVAVLPQVPGVAVGLDVVVASQATEKETEGGASPRRSSAAL